MLRAICFYQYSQKRSGAILFLCLTLPCLCAAIFPSAPAAEPGENTPYILAVHPYLPPFEIKKRYSPLADYLSGKLAHPVVIRVSSDYVEHIRAIGADRVEFAFAGPAPYVHMVADYGMKNLLARIETSGQPVFTGNIVVRKDSAVNSLNELKGARFAFVSRESTMGFLLPYRMLLARKVTLDDLAMYDFLNSHQNVALAVKIGDFDAGAVKHEVFLAMRDSLRSIAETPKISEHLFLASKKLNPEVIAKARAALLAIKKEKNGAQILQSIKPDITDLVEARDGDYDSIRTLLALRPQDQAQ